MTWQLLLIAYLILGTATYLFQRTLGKRFAEHRRLISGFFFLVLHYPSGLLVAAYLSPHLAIGWLNILILLIGSWVFPLINVLSIRASKDVDAGLFSILVNLAPVVTIIGATLLLKESLTNNQLLGAAIILASAFLATLPNLSRRAKAKPSGVLIVLAIVLLSGLATIYERWMLGRIDLGSYMVFGWGAQTLWMTLMAWPERKNLKVLLPREKLLPMLGFGLASSIKGICFIAALKLNGNASMVSAITAFIPVMVVPAAFIFLRERKWLWFKLAAALVGTAGLIILNGAWPSLAR